MPLENRGVDAAEIVLVLQISIPVEIGEIRIDPVDPPFDSGPEQEVRRGGAVVGSEAAVLLHSPTELGDREHQHTVEEPLALPEQIARLDADVVLVDCLTLWLSNLMMADHPDPEGEVDRLVAALDRPGTVILVTNEVGLGIVPDNALARRFRDIAGRAHQKLAARADEVYAGMLGLMLRLKPGPVEAVSPGARS